MRFRELVPWGRTQEDVTVRRDDPFFALHDRMNRLFEDLFQGFGLRPVGGGGGAFESTGPRVDVTESDDALHVRAELPGVAEEDVDVSLSDDSLTIRGEKKAETKEEKDGVYHVERSFGSFHRTIPLPYEVDSEKAEARFERGILVIDLPKLPTSASKSKRIEIRSRE